MQFKKLFSVAALVAASTLAHATTYQWDTNGATAGLGGVGTWNTTSAFWDLVGTGTDNGTDTTTAYTFTNADTAVFGGTAGTVTLGATTTVNALTFNTNGYSITGSTLTLAGTTPVISTAAGTTAVISSNLAGTAGFTKEGAGTLTINTATANTLSGTVAVNAGTLIFDYANSASNTAKVAATSTLALGGGTFQLKGKPSGFTTVQNFAGLVINSGSSNAVSTQTGTGTTGINYNTITRSGIGGTVDFSGNGLHQTNGMVNTNGTIGGYATLNGNTWVVATAAFGNLTGLATFSTNIMSADTQNVDVTTSFTATGNAANSVRFNNAGARTLTLQAGAATTITSGGILVTSAVGNNASLITGGTSLAGAAGKDLIVHQHNTANTLTIGSNIVDNTTATGLTKAGAGELVLSGTNSYTGNTYVNAGIVTFANAASFYGSTGGAVSGANAQKLIVNNGATASFNVATGNFDTTDITTLLTNSTASAGFKSGSGLGIDTTGVTGGTYTYGATITDANGGANSIGLTKTGTGTLALANANTHTGATTIAAGTLNLSHTGALGASTFTGGAGALVFDASVAGHTFTFGGLSGSKNIALTDNGSNAVALTVGANHSSTSYSGALSGSGSLTKTGTGLLVLDGTNTHTGGTTVSSGTLKVSGTLGAATGAVNVGAAGTLYLGGTQQTVGAVTVTGGTITGGMLNATSFSATGGNISTALTGSGALTKTTAGTLTVSGANTYSGGTNLNAGTIVVGASGVAGTTIPAGFKIAAVGDSITFGGWNTTVQAEMRARMGNSNVTVTNYGNSGSTAIYELGNIGPAHPYTGTSTYTGALASNPNVVVIQLGTNDSIATSAQIQQYYAADLTTIINAFKGTANNPAIYLALPPVIYSTGAQNEGRLTADVIPLIQQVAAATGATVIDNHTMMLNESALYVDGLHPNTVGTAMLGRNIYAALAADYFTNGPLGTGTITLSGGTLSDDGSARTLQNSLAITGDVTFASTGNGSLTFDSAGLAAPATTTLSNSPTITVTNTTSIAENISGSGFTKTGAGMLTLSGANTYTGGTTVTNGTLNAANNTAGQCALGAGNVTVSGGKLAINDVSVGQVTLGTGATLAMTSGSLAIDITGTSTFDKIVGDAAGHFLLTGGTLELTGFAGFEGTGGVGKSYSLFNGFAGTGNSVTGLTISGYDTTNWVASLDVATGTLSFTAVPEPSTYGLIGAGALAGVAFVRRRRRRAGKVAA